MLVGRHGLQRQAQQQGDTLDVVSGLVLLGHLIEKLVQAQAGDSLRIRHL